MSITLTETTGSEYKMVPGATIAKDPKVAVVAGSEACYVFVKIEKANGFDTYMEYAMAAGWNELTGVSGVYYRQVDAETAKTGATWSVLSGDQVTVKTSVTKDQMQLIDGVIVEGVTEQAKPTLTFTAYAIQSENLDTTDMAEIWALAQGQQN